MIIIVTQEDIDKGQRHSACNCPIALALTRACGKRIRVGPDSCFSDREMNTEHRLPISVRNFIRDFDDERLVFPFEFEIEMVLD